jgi:hypothetical protein
MMETSLPQVETSCLNSWRQASQQEASCLHSRRQDWLVCRHEVSTAGDKLVNWRQACVSWRQASQLEKSLPQLETSCLHSWRHSSQLETSCLHSWRQAVSTAGDKLVSSADKLPPSPQQEKRKSAGVKLASAADKLSPLVSCCGNSLSADEASLSPAVETACLQALTEGAYPLVTVRLYEFLGHGMREARASRPMCVPPAAHRDRSGTTRAVPHARRDRPPQPALV